MNQRMRIIDEVEEGSKRDFYDEILLYKEVGAPDFDPRKPLWCTYSLSDKVLLFVLIYRKRVLF